MSSETDPPAAEEPSSGDTSPDAPDDAANRGDVTPHEEPAPQEPAALAFGPPGSVTPRQLLEKYRVSWRTYPKLWIAGVIVVVAIAGVLVWPWFDTGDDEAETRVRAYLEALRDKDLPSANDIAKINATGDRQLLTDGALDTNWTIHTVRSKDFDDEGLTAEVMTVLKAANEEEYARYDFRLSRAGNESGADYMIDNGHIKASVGGVNTRNMEVNGVTVASDGTNEDYLEAKELLLYPGIYRFGHAFEDFVDVDWQRQLWTGGSFQVDVTGDDVDTAELDPRETWKFNSAGHEQAQELMDSHIDDCAEEEAGLIRECPFGAEDVEVPGDEDYIFYTDGLDDISWEIVEYPEVAVAQQGDRFRFADRTRGVANMTATGERSDGTVVDIDVECEIRTSSLTLTTDDSGELDVAEYQEFPELRMWSTC